MQEPSVASAVADGGELIANNEARALEIAVIQEQTQCESKTARFGHGGRSARIGWQVRASRANQTSKPLGRLGGPKGRARPSRSVLSVGTGAVKRGNKPIRVIPPGQEGRRRLGAELSARAKVGERRERQQPPAAIRALITDPTTIG